MKKQTNIFIFVILLLLVSLAIFVVYKKNLEYKISSSESTNEDSALIAAETKRENSIIKYGNHDKYMEGIAVGEVSDDKTKPLSIKSKDGTIYSFYVDPYSEYTSPYGDIIPHLWRDGNNIRVYYDGELTEDPTTAIVKSLTTTEFYQRELEEDLALRESIILQMEDPKVINGEEAMLAVIKGLGLENMIYYEVANNPTRNYFSNGGVKISLQKVMFWTKSIASKRELFFNVDVQYVNSTDKERSNWAIVDMCDGAVYFTGFKPPV